MTDDTVTFEGVRVKTETAKALLVVLATGEQHWIPKGLIHDDSEVYKQDTTGDLIIPRWWAEKEGIE